MKKETTSPTAILFIGAQGGDNTAMSDLICRIEKRLYRFSLFLTKNPEAARDLTQESLIKVIEKIHTIENPKSFMSWLFKVTKNNFINYLNSAATKRTENMEDSHLELGAVSGKHDLGLQIAGAISQLSAEDRCLVLMICVEGQSYEQAAEFLNLSEDSVRARLYRLRKFVKSQIFTKDRQ